MAGPFKLFLIVIPERIGFNLMCRRLLFLFLQLSNLFHGQAGRVA